MQPDLSKKDLSEEQLKALYDSVRIRIAHLLLTPRTPKQVADVMNIKPNNLYYHFKVLEKAGIIEHIETKKGKGFIKENYYKLKAETIKMLPEYVPISGHMKFMQSLIRAAIEDLNESIDSYDKVAGVGVRDDFSLSEDGLEKAKGIIIARKDKLMEELKELHNPEGECNYQLSLFCFRL